VQFWGCALLPNGSQGVWTQTWRGHSAIIFTQEVLVSAFGYLAAFSNAGGSKLCDVWNHAEFYTFLPHVNITGGVGEIETNCQSFTYDRTSEIHLMAMHCTAGSTVDR